MKRGRNDQRISVADNADATVTIMGETEKLKIVDISDAGICFLSKKKLDTDKDAVIHLTFLHENESLNEKIKVVRCTKVVLKDQESDLWEIGAQFVD